MARSIWSGTISFGLISIPVRGRVASLNVSAAAATVIFEAVRQRGRI